MLQFKTGKEVLAHLAGKFYDKCHSNYIWWASCDKSKLQSSKLAARECHDIGLVEVNFVEKYLAAIGRE